MSCIWQNILTFSSLTKLLVKAAHDLDLVGFQRRLIVELEVDVSEFESPHIVTEAVGIKVTLFCQYRNEQRHKRLVP